ncbi:MAG TPA: S8 family serine peptidase [Longimicrobium sp.]|nr:S8 family serine peptidase [Longimicrobium sp.]
MKRFTPVLLAILGLAACTDRNPAAAPGRDAAAARREASAVPGEDFVAGQIIVRFTPGANRSEVAEAHRAHKKDDMRLERTEILEVPVGQELEVAAQMAKNPNVEFAEPDWIQKVGPCEVASACTLPDGQFFVYKWDLQNTGKIVDTNLGYGTVTTGKAGADSKWAETYDYLGAGFQGSAVIAILDTGIRTTHQAFTGKILRGQRFVVDGQPATNYTDDNGHGSHVAGIAAGLGTAAVPGIAYGANIKLLIGKVCNAAGSCPSSATANAIVWAADNGANVINMSLGSFGGNPDGTGSAAQQAALQYAASKNVLPVCATGNDDNKPGNGYTGGVAYPGRFPECMAVAATTWSDTKASYSNYGPQTAISAPGGDSNPTGNPFSLILAPNYTSNTGYAWKAGTSMATPQVAGLAALLWATGLHDANAIRARIMQTADDLGAPGTDPIFGAGRINVYRAITGNDTKAPPVVNAGGVYNGNKGVPVQFDGSASYDPNGKGITFAWAFGDGGTSTDAKPVHTYARAGTYNVTLTVRDAAGLTTTVVTQAIIPNLVPVVSPFAGATLLRGETYTSAGSFTDADPDAWTATVNYGDGSGTQTLALSPGFSLSHTYAAAGVFTVNVAVSDDDGGTGTGTAQVTVWSAQQGINALAQQVSGMGLSNLNPLTNAIASLDRGSAGAAVNQMDAFVNQVNALVNSHRLTRAQGDELIAFANRIIRSING